MCSQCDLYGVNPQRCAIPKINRLMWRRFRDDYFSCCNMGNLPTLALWLMFLKYIFDNRRVFMFTKGRKTWKRRNEPKVVIGCEYKNIRHCGRSSAYRTAPHPWIDSIQDKIINLINHPENRAQNTGRAYPGTCAEHHAAEKTILEHNRIYGRRTPPLKSLVFTLPIRPRTLEYITACDICATMYTPCPVV